MLFSFRFPYLFVWAKMAAVFGGLPLLSHHNGGVYSHQFFVYAQTRIRLLSVGIYLIFFLFRFPCFQFKLPRLTFTTHHFSYLFNIFHFAIYSIFFFFLLFRASTGLRFFWPFKNLFASLLYCYGLCSFCFRSLGFYCCRQCRRWWIVFVNFIVFSDLIVLYTQAFYLFLFS